MGAASDSVSTSGHPGDPSSTSAVPARRRGLWAIVAGAVLVLIASVAVGLWMAPDLIRAQALKTLDETYHRRARLDRVRLDPLALRIELDGFSLPDRDGRPMVAFRTLAVGVSPASLWSGRLALTEVDLDRPAIRAVRRADGTVNLADLAPPSRKPSGPEKPFSLRVDRFRLHDGDATLIDQQGPAPIERRLLSIALSLSHFSTTADRGDYHLSASTDAGETIDWRGVAGIAPIASSGRFHFGNWRAAPLAALAAQAHGGALPVTVSDGLIDVSGAYRFKLIGQKPALRVDIDRAGLRDAAFRAPGAGEDWVKLGAIEVTNAHLDLQRADLSLGHILVTAPDVTAWLDKAGVNLVRFAPATAATEALAPSARPPTDWTIEAPDIRLTTGRLAFEDRTARQTVAIAAYPVAVNLAGLAWPLVNPVRITAGATLDDGATVSASGSVIPPTGRMESPSGIFDVAVAHVDLTKFQPYVRETAKLVIAGGEVSARGTLGFGGPGGVAYRGGLEVDDLETVDPTLKSDLLTWDSLALSDITAVASPLNITVKQVVAKGAYARVVLEPNYVVNIRDVLETPGAVDPGAAAAGGGHVQAGLAAIALSPLEGFRKRAPAPKPVNRPAAPPGPALPFRIDKVVLEGGQMDFTDLTVAPHFAAGVQSLNGTVTGLSGRPDSRATVDLKGGVDLFAPVTISGTVNPFAADKFTDLRMNFQNIGLTTFSPYSGKFAGYRIDKGKLNVDMHYLVDNEKLTATHHVVIEQLQLGERVDSTDAVKLPMKLIVSLLKDRNGVIDLPIDVSGSLDDPKFRIWPIIWKVVGNLFDKIAAAPFTLLGNLIGGGGGEELSHIRFEPGQAVIADAERRKLASLAKALAARPQLSLEIPMTDAPAIDAPVLSEALYRDALTAAARTAGKGRQVLTVDQVLASPKLKRRALEGLYLRTFGEKPAPPKAAPPAQGQKADPDRTAIAWFEARLRAHFVAGDQAVQSLAQARAQAVEAALVDQGKVEPARLFVITAKPLAQGPIDMTLALR